MVRLLSRKMKDSGIEWIGEMPEDWEVAKLGKVASIQTGNTPSMQGNENYYEDGFLLWVKPDNLNSFTPITDTEEKINKIGYNKARVVKPNTPLVCCIGTIGKFGYSEEEVAYNQQINALEFNENTINWKYGMYCLSTQEEQHWYYSTGNVVQILNTQNQKKIALPIPELHHQQKIVNFLDEKVAEIDHILKKTRESIEEYKKYKQSIITEAVTKGLNPDVKMKDSWIEWIGEIPEHWTPTRLKYVGECFGGLTYSPNDVSSEGEGMLVLRSSNVQNGKLDFNDNVYVTMDVPEKLVAKKGDILVCSRNGSRNLIGKNALIGEDYGYTFGAFMTIVRTNSFRFVHYFLNSNIFDAQSSLFLTSTVNQLTLGVLNNMKLVLPGEEEQDEIADYLDKKTIKLDLIIQQKEQLLSDLEAYKKSLIYECATGKREVV